MIEPPRGWLPVRPKELWDYRELIFFLAWRDVLVRYKQAVLGVAWAVIQPVMAMVVISTIFGTLAKLPSEGIPYPVFVFSALLPWQLFAESLQRAGTSLVANANLLTKVHFPRLVIPLSAVLACMVDFLISSAVLALIMAYYGVVPSWSAVLWLPALAVLALLTALSVAIWLSALNVLYRDFQHTIPFLVQIWMYASPVAYSADLIPSGRWRLVYSLNPMTGVIQGFRWALAGGRPPEMPLFLSVVVVFVLLVGGLFYFKKMERFFADVV